MAYCATIWISYSFPFIQLMYFSIVSKLRALRVRSPTLKASALRLVLRVFLYLEYFLTFLLHFVDVVDVDCSVLRQDLLLNIACFIVVLLLIYCCFTVILLLFYCFFFKGNLTRSLVNFIKYNILQVHINNCNILISININT